MGFREWFRRAMRDGALRVPPPPPLPGKDPLAGYSDDAVDALALTLTRDGTHATPAWLGGIPEDFDRAEARINALRQQYATHPSRRLRAKVNGWLNYHQRNIDEYRREYPRELEKREIRQRFGGAA